MTIYSAVLIQYQRVTDRRTDRRPVYKPYIYYVLQHVADARKNNPESVARLRYATLDNVK